jgi:peptidoglycan/LPS O-acetylase OafA/YrhL
MKLKFAKAYYYTSLTVLGIIGAGLLVFLAGALCNAFIGGNGPLDWRGYALAGCIILAIAIVCGLVGLFNWSEKLIIESDLKKNDK